MKKLILLSILLFGWLSNYAQIYKVTFHKPVPGTKDNNFDGKWSKNKGSYYQYTINDTYTYEEDSPLSEVSNKITYITEEPKTLHFYSDQHFARWFGSWFTIWENHRGYSNWTKDFENGKVEGSGIAYDDGYYIYNCDIMVTYEQLYCNCKFFDNLLCENQTLDFTNTFEVPYKADIFVATTSQPDQLYDLNIPLAAKVTSFSVKAIDILNFIDYNTKFDIYVKFYTQSIFDIKKHYKATYKIHFNGINAPVPYKDNKPHIEDNKLVIPNIGNVNPKDYRFILSGETISQSYDASEYNDVPVGKFELQISDKEKKQCQVNYDAYVPKIEYNYLDDIKEHTHWYDEDYKSNAIQLKICYLDDGSVNYDFSITGTYPKNSEHTFKSSPGTKIPIEKVQKYNEEHQPYGEVDLSASPYTIGCYPDLDSITIVPNDIEHSIYTIISTQNQGEKTGKLKYFPPIDVNSKKIPAHCSYSPYQVKINSIGGGLTDGKLNISFNDFKYKLKIYYPKTEETQEIEEPEIPDDGIIIIPNNNQQEFSYEISFYDANITDEDANHNGEDARKFTIDETKVVMPDALYIPAPSISHPLCTFDSNGSIAINTANVTLSYPGKTANYTWSVIKGDEKNQTTTSIGLGPTISDLPAGFYQVELNNDNCIATGSYELIDPPLLEFESTTSSNAKCYGYSDGSIFTNVKGGTPGYKYSWNVGATSNNLLNIPKGKYKLTVLDAHKCQIQTDTIKITEPAEVINTFIAHDYSICQDSELEIDAGDFAD
ncbi:MAG: SprB repeat-containing protein, partial [Bacteroidales bacterium]|nr:SprB repeat-containing protein [Bacteroidales bacterium]